MTRDFEERRRVEREKKIDREERAKGPHGWAKVGLGGWFDRVGSGLGCGLWQSKKKKKKWNKSRWIR